MRIKTFCKLVEVESRPLALRDCAAVLDAQNYFYKSYTDAGLTSAFGIESDRYARYLRKHLDMFNKANVKCYFLFKGGHENMEKRLMKDMADNHWALVPLLVKNTYKQTLSEMGFEYVVCEYESKGDILELAEELNCPIISFDIEFAFSGLQYIPSNTLKFNECDNTIQCSSFLFADFLKKYKLTVEQMAVFILLRDELFFSEEVFKGLFSYIKAPLGNYKRNLHLLRWLSKSNRETVMKTISMFISAENKKRFVEEESKAAQLMRRRPCGGLGAACARRRGAARVARADPAWFPKGVAAGHVAVHYVNLYRSKHLFGSDHVEGLDNATIVALDIIYYAYDLLTDFNNDGFNLVYNIDCTDQGRRTMPVTRTHDIPKPAYEAEVSVFENGWESVAALGLLEHFVQWALGPASLRRLKRVPAPARLPLLALAYWARRRPGAPAAPAAVLLSYVMLDVVNDKTDSKTLPKPPFDKKPLLASTTDMNDVTEADCNIAAAVMEEYFNASDSDAEFILDHKLLHALVEIQQCLAQLLALNALCGAPLRAPLLRRMYNGTLAYKLLRAAERAADPVLFLDHLLSPAPTVYAFFNGLYETYEELL